MKNPVIAIPSFALTMIVYASSPIFFEMNYNAYGEGVNYIVFSDGSNIDLEIGTKHDSKIVVSILSKC